jgi:RNA polymerase sigma-70 factor (ECF subfamily)
VVEAAQAGAGALSREGTFEALVRSEAETVLRLARRLLGEPDEAQDLAQDALLKAWRALPTFRGEASLRTWLLRIVLHEGLKRIRHRRVVDRVLGWLRAPVPRGADPESLAGQGEQVRILARALEALPARQRAVVTLHHLEGLTLPEIAQLLEVEPGTVKTHLVRGLARVRGEWEKAHGKA